MDDTVLKEVRKAPEDTLRDVKPLLEEAGVTRIANITGMDRIGIPVFAAIRPDSKSLAVDSGKGISKAQAKCSAAMEAIERWAQDHYEIKSIRTPNIVERNYAYKFPMVRGAKFVLEYSQRWTEGEYITQHGTKVMVPYYHVKNYEGRLPIYEMCWQSGTNGLAAGNTRNEAILQGLYEIIERDAVTSWMWRGMKTGETKRIDEDTINDTTAQDLLGMCSDCGVQACIYDATSDIGIPTFICLLVDSRADLNVYKGYRCNFDSNIALQMSICEAAQSRAVFLSGGRDDMRWANHALESTLISNKQRLRELGSEKTHPYYPHDYAYNSDTDTISVIDALLTSKGCGRVIVVDIMAREHCHVVKVMSEQLEGYWNPYLELGERARR